MMVTLLITVMLAFILGGGFVLSVLYFRDTPLKLENERLRQDKELAERRYAAIVEVMAADKGLPLMLPESTPPPDPKPDPNNSWFSFRKAPQTVSVVKLQGGN